MEQLSKHRLNIAQSVDWKDAVIALVEPRSPYRPWRYGTTEAKEDDTVAFVLNTDPPSVLADLGHVEANDELEGAVFERTLYQPNVVELSTLAKVLDMELWAATAWHYDGDEAIKLELSLEECRYCCAPQSRFGHNTMAAARTLLRFNGECDGCDRSIDLTGHDARDQVFVHTVDQVTRLDSENVQSGVYDWPAVLCRRCRKRMDDEGYTRFVDFKFELNPLCPRCGAGRSSETFYGMPSDHMNIPPWSSAGGCCPTPEDWWCGVCGHRW